MKKQLTLLAFLLFSTVAFADAHDYHDAKKGTAKEELEMKSEKYLREKRTQHDQDYKDHKEKVHKDFYEKKRKYGP